MTNTDNLKKQFKMLQIIWVAMIAPLAIYLIISHMAGDSIKEGASARNEIPLDMLKNILYIVSIIELGAAYYIRKIILKVNPEMTGATAIQKYIAASIITFFLSESVGIYGLVLYLLGDEMFNMYIFIIISAAALFYFHPDFEDMETYVNSAKL